MALLAMVIVSPYVKPLQFITTRLGLTHTEVVYVPINHTVYVNQTVVKYVYVNKTVPVYINRTVYVYVNNASNPLYAEVMNYIPPGILNNLTLPTLLMTIENASFCYAKVIVLNNGTAWSAAVLGLGSGYAKYLQNLCVNSTYTYNGIEYCYTYFNVGGVWANGTFDITNEYVQINGTPIFLMLEATVLSPTYDGYHISNLFDIDRVNVSNGYVYFNDWAVPPLNSTVLAKYYFGNTPYMISGPCLINITGPLPLSTAEQQLLPLPPLWQWFRYVAGSGNVTNYTYGFEVDYLWQLVWQSAQGG